MAETRGGRPISASQRPTGGDKAVATSGAASGLPSRVVMLYVMKGNALITIGLSGLDDEAAVEKAKGVAQKILAQL